MFKIEKTDKNRLDIQLDGKLDSGTMAIALDELVELSKDIENGVMLYQINDFQLPTLSAIGVEFSRLPSMFRMIAKFNRAAVLSDKSWIKTISEIEGMLIPSLEIKAFDISEKEAAEAWLAETK